MEWDDPDASLQDSHQGRHKEGRYRRIEVITGRRRRRNWTPAEKARVIAESAESAANISAAARHWGVSRGLLPVWRRQWCRRKRLRRRVPADQVDSRPHKWYPSGEDRRRAYPAAMRT
ncbi:MAG: hypothetical protein E5X88_28145 [Mesorhizobium sp.]|uniref:transposase n=1 Tax=Mesorhizobium sp. TaxID=1871066 RepID=UPI000FE45AE8|nr:transposase [Mesorhizobium sp.]RWH31406.1 MAG: hypothetical protein EOQ76_08270 [Mesorhizobium sp.]RWH38648.1 MAG: hypothetical protein EOQ79_10260 [Mesorhizobium sp.]TIM67183.1 MAG: hypothetical protein E5Y52_12280 [Mesorhizobium sp.]TIO05231.1 MAG: hypothetical protein E5X88_28145 [Mesorhizobium sp.]TIR61888.1 MAG: hypothetical protein E5X22_02895 [Mesorhizobium sp.]